MEKLCCKNYTRSHSEWCYEYVWVDHIILSILIACPFSLSLSLSALFLEWARGKGRKERGREKEKALSKWNAQPASLFSLRTQSTLDENIWRSREMYSIYTWLPWWGWMNWLLANVCRVIHYCKVRSKCLERNLIRVLPNDTFYSSDFCSSSFTSQLATRDSQ